MVCMGNICRSPIAEGVLRAKLLRAGLQRRVVVDSAGTSGMHGGEAPDPRGIRKAAARGYAIGALRARGVVDADFQNFDLILAMDSRNLQWLRDRAPVPSPASIEMLLSRSPPASDGTSDVPDPYYGAEQGFDRVLDLVEGACDEWVRRWSRPAPQ
ncbi:MAG: low molecular weight protein-tyrosine-phosphatase [Rubrivivax sp.]